jgi:protein-tyrosine kinase
VDLIEKAAQRLAELKKAGIHAPTPETAPDTSAPAAEAIPTPERLAQALERAQAPTDAREPAVASHARTMMPTEPAPRGLDGTETGPHSKFVQIDLEALALAGFVTPSAQRSQIADEFRVIKRPIIRNAHQQGSAHGERANLVMVTSAVPGEGKSFVSLNLAMSIALEVDSTVLLVDADVANPSLMRLTHLSQASKGLLDLLTSANTKLPDVLLKTNVDKLSLLPSGTSHGRATEMLASETMASLLEEMSARYTDRILVFDSPPLLATTEARALALHMGQIVLVVEADRTPQALVQHALETIESCPVVMLVLNKAPRPEIGSYYGHHYGPYYGATPAAS